MAARVVFVSAVSRVFTHSVDCTLLSRSRILGLTLRHVSFVGRFPSRNVYLPLLHCISSIHSTSCSKAKVNLWDEYSRVKSYVEGNQ